LRQSSDAAPGLLNGDAVDESRTLDRHIQELAYRPTLHV
jgi:hypothetical protein